MQEAITYDLPLIPSRYSVRLLDYLSQKGIQEKAINQLHPTTSNLLHNPDTYLTINQTVPILETLQEMLRDERAGFEFGQQLDLIDHGLFGYILLSSGNPFQLIETVVRHINVGLPLLEMETIVSGYDIVIRLNNVLHIENVEAFIAKIYMGSIYAIASTICREIRFDCHFISPVPDINWHALAPNSEWIFNAPCNQVTLRHINPASVTPKIKTMQALINHHCMTPSTTGSIKTEPKKCISTQVREMIMKSPRYTNIERCAERLSISSRYLRQQLSAENTSYREISNQVKLDFATLYLQETNMPITEIAYKLGFGDQASFTKAFRSWTNKTPGEVRKSPSL